MFCDSPLYIVGYIYSCNHPLIFTFHDLSIKNHCIFRKDKIWFTAKGKQNFIPSAGYISFVWNTMRGLKIKLHYVIIIEQIPYYKDRIQKGSFVRKVEGKSNIL